MEEQTKEVGFKVKTDFVDLEFEGDQQKLVAMLEQYPVSLEYGKDYTIPDHFDTETPSKLRVSKTALRKLERLGIC